MPRSTEIARQKQESRHRARRAERRARVGIIANPVELVQPAVIPREVWTRWPKLRSSRRPGREKPGDAVKDHTTDPVLSGESLRSFVAEMRKAQGHRRSTSNGPIPMVPQSRIRPILTRPLLLVASGIFVTAAALSIFTFV